jgi:hypothetical protein
MAHESMQQLSLRLTRLEGQVTQAAAGALCALDAVSRIGEGLDVDMPRVFAEARERLAWKQGGLQLKPRAGGGHTPQLPPLAQAAETPRALPAPGTPGKPPKGEKKPRVQRVCAITGSHQICKDSAGVKIRRMPVKATHKPKT